MKLFVTLLRWIAGLLFIFSGVVKAIDPNGLAYKMQEFFEAWANAGFLRTMMFALNDYALAFSIIMITLEVGVGIALILGWQKRLTAWVLLLLILFFTFLTSYVLFSGKIKACGCFGDCIPITPIQTFTKDLVLLVMAIIIITNLKYIHPLLKPLMNGLLLFAGVGAAFFIQYNALKHLPVKDCLPFKVGNNILELRKMPQNAIADEKSYKFIYEKSGVQKEFEVSSLPDSSWTFVSRKEVVLKLGSNNIPLINDFNLTDSNGVDVTEKILSQQGNYYLLFMKDVPKNTDQWLPKFKALMSAKHMHPFYIVSAQPDAARLFFRQLNIIIDVLSADGTAIKTAARANPTLLVMHGETIAQKLSWADLHKVK